MDRYRRDLIGYLGQFITPQRLSLYREVLEQRTRYITNYSLPARQRLMLKWLRQSIRRSDLIEKKFRENYPYTF